MNSAQLCLSSFTICVCNSNSVVGITISKRIRSQQSGYSNYSFTYSSSTFYTKLKIGWEKLKIGWVEAIEDCTRMTKLSRSFWFHSFCQCGLKPASNSFYTFSATFKISTTKTYSDFRPNWAQIMSRHCTIPYCPSRTRKSQTKESAQSTHK